MIYLNLMPCSNCEYFQGVKRHGKTEKSEYAKCEIAKGNDAVNLLKTSGFTISCEKQKRIWED